MPAEQQVTIQKAAYKIFLQHCTLLCIAKIPEGVIFSWSCDELGLCLASDWLLLTGVSKLHICRFKARLSEGLTASFASIQLPSCKPGFSQVQESEWLNGNQSHEDPSLTGWSADMPVTEAETAEHSTSDTVRCEFQYLSAQRWQVQRRAYSKLLKASVGFISFLSRFSDCSAPSSLWAAKRAEVRQADPNGGSVEGNTTPHFCNSPCSNLLLAGKQRMAALMIFSLLKLLDFKCFEEIEDKH